MSYFKFEKTTFGHYKTIKLINTNLKQSVEIALTGATILNFMINRNGKDFSIIDGFATPEEFKAARGARCWIMTPFANRIPDGKYVFDGNEYQLKPIPPRDQVIHGFSSYKEFSIDLVEENDHYISIVLKANINKNDYEGYPFDVEVKIRFTLSDNNLNIKVNGINNSDKNLPFWSGWHPYFKTNKTGIEDLILTINADFIIGMDSNLIPPKGKAAYLQLDNHPDKDYREDVPLNEREISKRVLDVCYAGLEFDTNGFAHATIFDPKEKIRITMYQKGGVTLAFSGDSLAQRKRMSIALEPMECLTNGYNREEYKDTITLKPGTKKTFEFGFKVGY